jgi:DNA invertase Pin-like site-specific DNA recombinase
MNPRLQPHHLAKPAYVYLRQSTQSQVKNHQESTERQYGLKDKAVRLGWHRSMVKVIDQDLGRSGGQFSDRPGFQSLVAAVSLSQVGAIFALEASRLARNSLDWRRLIEICTFTKTLVIDEQDCYDPSHINDAILLDVKGTFAQAELEQIRERLHGAKLNKAKKGELHSRLPVGLCYHEDEMVLDPDMEIQGGLRLLFQAFQQTGSAYGVAHHFAARRLLFPKRVHGGADAGKVRWGRLTEHRAAYILRHPAYAGAYVYGRYKTVKEISSDCRIRSRRVLLPREAWEVVIPDHHAGYISWDEYLRNVRTLEKNQTNAGGSVLSGPAREGLALLQGLLICSVCGHRLSVRYKGTGGIYPTYQCTGLKRECLTRSCCISIRSHVVDSAISKRVLEVLKPHQIEIATEALLDLEQRNDAACKQWRMRVERAEYQAQLAQRRYEEVDPGNRLVAANLERRWNDALLEVEQAKTAFTEFQSQQGLVVTPTQKAQVLRLAEDFGRIWNAPSTEPKDKKRMLRHLIEDITIVKIAEEKQALLCIRWQGGACEELRVDLPRPVYEAQRYSLQMVDRVRELAKKLRDREIAELFNREGKLSSKGKSFSGSIVEAIRYKHKIPGPQLKRPGELSVHEVAEKFAVTRGTVYDWIRQGMIEPRRSYPGGPFWITLDASTEAKLLQRVRTSPNAKLYNKEERKTALRTGRA